MATLTREQYLKEFAKEITSTKENAILFFNEIGVLTPTGDCLKIISFLQEIDLDQLGNIKTQYVLKCYWSHNKCDLEVRDRIISTKCWV